MNTVDNLVEKNLFTHPDWQRLLKACDLDSFEDFWQIELELVDEGNQGRGDCGWSHVGFYTLDSDTGPSRTIVVKRQQNYFSRTWKHLFRGILTFAKEFAMLQRCQQYRIPVPEVVFFATRQQDRQHQAILATARLDGCQSFLELLNSWSKAPGHWRQRTCIMTAIADTLSQFHNQGLEHRCLYPKHLFLSTNQQQVRCILIDLEKTRWVPWRKNFRTRDLTQLAKYSTQLSARDMIVFVRAYLQQKRLDASGKALWALIKRQVERKKRQRTP